MWLPNGEMSGYAKVIKNLQFLVVYNSGHLVPYNQPRHSLDLILRVVKGKRFLDHQIPVVFKTAATIITDSKPKAKTGWSGDSNREETLILILVSFAFGYATSIVLSRLHIHCFGRGDRGYEMI
jgi:hypothetical protein